MASAGRSHACGCPGLLDHLSRLREDDALEIRRAGAEPNAETLSRAQLDSAALITENTLAAWGLPFDFLHADVDIPKISDAFRERKNRNGRSHSW